MNEEFPNSDQLDLYLDGQLDARQAQRFEMELTVNEDLRNRLELQARVDETLKRQFTPPVIRAHPPQQSRVPAASGTSNRFLGVSRRTIMNLALAAGGLAAALVVWRFYPGQPPVHVHVASYHSQPLVQLYQQSVSAGFQPKWLCDNDREFAETFQRRQGQALVLSPLPQGSRMVGLAYLGGFSPSTTTLMCFVDQQPVMVFVDRRDWDIDENRVQPAEGVQVFRRELAGLVLYEVTPFGEPRALHYLQAVSQLPLH